MDAEKASNNSLKDQIKEVQSKEEGTIDDAQCVQPSYSDLKF